MVGVVGGLVFGSCFGGSGGGLFEDCEGMGGGSQGWVVEEGYRGKGFGLELGWLVRLFKVAWRGCGGNWVNGWGMRGDVQSETS